jgi:outer membrane receptor for ferrienterochelin and colicins
LRDTDEDGWADIPEVDRLEARPRLFFDWPGGHSLLVTAGGTTERRAGGIVPSGTAAGGVAYREEVRTRRGDVGAVAHRLVGDRGLLQLRASGNVDDKEKLFGNVPENVTRSTGFGELSFGNSLGMHDVLGGAAAEVDRATVLEDGTIDYSFTTLSVFAQDAWRFSRFSLTGSARMDHHSRYGTQVSPRLSLLAQLARGWTTRVSLTQGFYAPTPFVEEADEVGVLRIVAPDNLRVERANYGSLDINGHQGPVELNATFFASRVHHPVTANTDSTSGKYLLTNALLDSRSHGMELFAVYDLEPLFITALYTYTNAHEPKSDLSAAFLSRYVPWHTGGIDVTWEAEETGTWIAVEAFYTGTQPIDDPNLSHGKPHMPIGVLVSQRIGRYKLFVNGENLTNVRQTNYAPLLLPSRAVTGEWTTGVWAPLEGRVISVGVRISAGDLAH